jgi:hypothetical protein
MAFFPHIFGHVDLPEPIALRPDRRVVGTAELRLVLGLEPWTRSGIRRGGS